MNAKRTSVLKDRMKFNRAVLNYYTIQKNDSEMSYLLS